MLQEIATVVAANRGCLTVETQSRSSCSSCSNHSCTTSVVAKLFNVQRNRFQLENRLGAQVGDQVMVSIPDGLLVRASVWVYLIPSVFMVFGAVFGLWAGWSDGAQAMFALFGLGLGFWLVGWMTRKQTVREAFRPQLEEILPNPQKTWFSKVTVTGRGL